MGTDVFSIQAVSPATRGLSVQSREAFILKQDAAVLICLKRRGEKQLTAAERSNVLFLKASRSARMCASACRRFLPITGQTRSAVLASACVPVLKTPT